MPDQYNKTYIGFLFYRIQNEERKQEMTHTGQKETRLQMAAGTWSIWFSTTG